jgi:hypothetical protein
MVAGAPVGGVEGDIGVGGPMNRIHDAHVLIASLLVPIGLAADAAPPSVPSAARGSLSVSAIVVRPQPPAEVAVQGGVVLIRNVGGVGVAVEGGAVRGADGATIRIDPSRSGVTRITLTY